ncbi:MAG TPA: arginine--tRNA ligase, partial [Microbacterium sp.]|nr:arginine--tRNA ligase [Microbacterium sp.]
MDPEALSAALLSVVAPLAQERQGGDVEGLGVADFPLERPRNRDHGDWASNAALKLAKRFGMPPRDLAAAIAERL